MMRRFLILAAVVTGATTFLGAQNAVTYVLMNGERVSGDIASYSEPSPGMPRGELNLERGDQEFDYGIEQVAAIVYVSGPPSASEIAALPGDPNEGMVALRDGNFMHGTLRDLRRQTLWWARTGGGVEQIPVDRISRIYLNVPAARRLLGANTSAGAPAAAPPTGRATQRGWEGASGGTIMVPGNQAWTDSGLNVRRGDRIRFAASGTIQIARGAAATPAGNSTLRARSLPRSGVPVGALIGKIGDNQPFAIGQTTDNVVMTADGRLWLGINDTTMGDNTGEFQVVVTRVLR